MVDMKWLLFCCPTEQIYEVVCRNRCAPWHQAAVCLVATVDEDDESIAWCNIKPGRDECMKPIKRGGGHQCQELFYKYY